jgi:hypothetical protein
MAWNDQPFPGSGQSGPMQQGSAQQGNFAVSNPYIGAPVPTTAPNQTGAFDSQALATQMPQAQFSTPSSQISISPAPATQMPVAPLVNPLQAQAQQAAPIYPSVAGSLASGPMSIPTNAGMVQNAPQPQAPQPLQPQAQQPIPVAASQTEDDRVPADDLTWINYARRAIAETRGDPHRQVQLLQHIRAQYLKQRFGRVVRTDEG